MQTWWLWPEQDKATSEGSGESIIGYGLSETTSRTEEAAVARSQPSDQPLALLNKGQRITGDERGALSDQLRRQYESGRSIRDLAADTGRSYGFVHRVLQESGATLRGRGGSNRRLSN